MLNACTVVTVLFTLRMPLASSHWYYEGYEENTEDPTQYLEREINEDPQINRRYDFTGTANNPNNKLVEASNFPYGYYAKSKPRSYGSNTAVDSDTLYYKQNTGTSYAENSSQGGYNVEDFYPQQASYLKSELSETPGQSSQQQQYDYYSATEQQKIPDKDVTLTPGQKKLINSPLYLQYQKYKEHLQEQTGSKDGGGSSEIASLHDIEYPSPRFDVEELGVKSRATLNKADNSEEEFTLKPTQTVLLQQQKNKDKQHQKVEKVSKMLSPLTAKTKTPKITENVVHDIKSNKATAARLVLSENTTEDAAKKQMPEANDTMLMMDLDRQKNGVSLYNNITQTSEATEIPTESSEKNNRIQPNIQDGENDQLTEEENNMHLNAPQVIEPVNDNLPSHEDRTAQVAQREPENERAFKNITEAITEGEATLSEPSKNKNAVNPTAENQQANTQKSSATGKEAEQSYPEVKEAGRANLGKSTENANPDKEESAYLGKSTENANPDKEESAYLGKSTENANPDKEESAYLGKSTENANPDKEESAYLGQPMENANPVKEEQQSHPVKETEQLYPELSNANGYPTKDKHNGTEGAVVEQLFDTGVTERKEESDQKDNLNEHALLKGNETVVANNNTANNTSTAAATDNKNEANENNKVNENAKTSSQEESTVFSPEDKEQTKEGSEEDSKETKSEESKGEKEVTIIDEKHENKTETKEGSQEVKGFAQDAEKSTENETKNDNLNQTESRVKDEASKEKNATKIDEEEGKMDRTKENIKEAIKTDEQKQATNKGEEKNKTNLEQRVAIKNEKNGESYPEESSGITPDFNNNNNNNSEPDDVFDYKNATFDAETENSDSKEKIAKSDEERSREDEERSREDEEEPRSKKGRKSDENDVKETDAESAFGNSRKENTMKERLDGESLGESSTGEKSSESASVRKSSKSTKNPTATTRDSSETSKYLSASSGESADLSGDSPSEHQKYVDKVWEKMSSKNKKEKGSESKSEENKSRSTNSSNEGKQNIENESGNTDSETSNDESKFQKDFEEANSEQKYEKNEKEEEEETHGTPNGREEDHKEDKNSTEPIEPTESKENSGPDKISEDFSSNEVLDMGPEILPQEGASNSQKSFTKSEKVSEAKPDKSPVEDSRKNKTINTVAYNASSLTETKTKEGNESLPENKTKESSESKSKELLEEDQNLDTANETMIDIIEDPRPSSDKNSKSRESVQDEARVRTDDKQIDEEDKQIDEEESMLNVEREEKRAKEMKSKRLHKIQREQQAYLKEKEEKLMTKNEGEASQREYENDMAVVDHFPEENNMAVVDHFPDQTEKNKKINKEEKDEEEELLEGERTHEQQQVEQSSLSKEKGGEQEKSKEENSDKLAENREHQFDGKRTEKETISNQQDDGKRTEKETISNQQDDGKQDDGKVTESEQEEEQRLLEEERLTETGNDESDDDEKKEVEQSPKPASNENKEELDEKNKMASIEPVTTGHGTEVPVDHGSEPVKTDHGTETAILHGTDEDTLRAEIEMTKNSRDMSGMDIPQYRDVVDESNSVKSQTMQSDEQRISAHPIEFKKNELTKADQEYHLIQDKTDESSTLKRISALTDWLTKASKLLKTEHVKGLEQNDSERAFKRSKTPKPSAKSKRHKVPKQGISRRVGISHSVRKPPVKNTKKDNFIVTDEGLKPQKSVKRGKRVKSKMPRKNLNRNRINRRKLHQQKHIFFMRKH